MAAQFEKGRAENPLSFVWLDGQEPAPSTVQVTFNVYIIGFLFPAEVTFNISKLFYVNALHIALCLFK